MPETVQTNLHKVTIQRGKESKSHGHIESVQHKGYKISILKTFYQLYMFMYSHVCVQLMTVHIHDCTHT